MDAPTTDSHLALADELPSAKPAMLVELAPLPGRRHRLRPVTHLGRESGNDILLVDPTVSRRHASIRQSESGDWLVRDLASTRGTQLDGQSVVEAPLRHGCELTFGNARLRFELYGHEPSNPGLTRVHALPLPEAGARFRPAKELASADDVKHDYEKLRIAFELTRSIGGEQDADRLADRILEAALWIFDADAGGLALLDEHGQPTMHRGRRRDGSAHDAPIPATVLRELVEHKQAVLCADAGIDERFSGANSMRILGIRSLISAPLLDGDRVLGVLHLDSRAIVRAFDARDLELLAFLASQAALTLRNSVLSRRIQDVQANHWRRLERVLRDLPMAVVLLDAEHRSLLANPEGERFLELLGSAGAGVRIDAIGGHPLESLVAGGTAAGPLEIELGAPQPRSYAVALSTSGMGEEREHLLMARDVTLARDQSARFLRQERLALIGQLASGVAHDVNNVLTVVLNASEWLARHIDMPRVREHTDVIDKEVRSVASLMRQILSFGRRADADTELLALDAHLKELELLLRRSIGTRISIELRLGTTHKRIRAARTRLEQVYLNLVVNARDAMPEGGTLGIATDIITYAAPHSGPERDLPAGEYLRVLVTDTGVGMPAEVAARAFEPFFTTKPAGKGTGLGLATVYDVVKECRGAVGFTTAPGAGTTFEIVLPSVTPEPRG